MARKAAGKAKASPKPPEQPKPEWYVSWTRDTVSVADAVQQHRNRRYNAADLIARVEGTIEACVRLRATCANSVPIRLYTTASEARSKRLEARSISRKRLGSIRNSRIVGKAAAYAEGAGEVVEVEWHPVLDLLRDPNHFQSGQAYSLLMWDFALTAGTAFEYVEESGGMPVAMLPMYPAWVTPQPSKEELVSGWWYYRGTPAERFYKASEVNAYQLYPDRSNPYIGRSPLRSIIKQADTLSAIVVEALSRIQNDCRIDHIWVAETPLTTEQQKEAEQRLNKYRGPRNKGKAAVVGQLKPVPIQWSYKDMEWKELDAVAQRSVRNAYMIPESLADLNDANLAGAAMGLEAFYSLAVQPDCMMRAEQLTDMLLPRFGASNGDMWFAPDNASREDDEKQARVLVSLTGGVRPILTVNEAREELGYEPLEWGDDPTFGQPTMGVSRETDEPIDVESRDVDAPALPGLPAGEPVQDTALNGAQVTALADVLDRVANGKLPVDAGLALARASFPAVKPEDLEAMFGPLRNFTPKPDPVEQAPAVDDEPDEEPPADGPDEMDDEDEAAEGAKSIDDILTASGWWFADGHGMGCQCETHKAIQPDPSMLALLNDWYADWGPTLAEAEEGERAALVTDARRQLATILRPELARLYAEGLGDIIGQAGQAVPETLSDAAVRGIDAYVSRLSTEVTGTLSRDVTAAIEASIRNGESVTEATRAVADAMGVQADWRAERVARTETGRVVEHGRLHGYREVGIDRKQWLLSNAPCQFCESAVAILNGRAPLGVPIDEPFFRAGETIVGTAGGVLVLDQDVMVPSDIHPNDACSLSGVRNR